MKKLDNKKIFLISSLYEKHKFFNKSIIFLECFKILKSHFKRILKLFKIIFVTKNEVK